MEKLETILEENQGYPHDERRGLGTAIYDGATHYLGRLKEHAKKLGTSDWMVDASAGWVAYTPAYAALEAVCGLESKEIVISRGIGLFAHAIFMRPVGKLRHYVAQRLDVTSERSWGARFAVNACTLTASQAIIYTGMLLLSGAEPEHIVRALPSGLAVGAIYNTFFVASFMDFWRKEVWGRKGAFDGVVKNDSVEKGGKPPPTHTTPGRHRRLRGVSSSTVSL